MYDILLLLLCFILYMTDPSEIFENSNPRSRSDLDAYPRPKSKIENPDLQSKEWMHLILYISYTYTYTYTDHTAADRWIHRWTIYIDGSLYNKDEIQLEYRIWYGMIWIRLQYSLPDLRTLTWPGLRAYILEPESVNQIGYFL